VQETGGAGRARARYVGIFRPDSIHHCAENGDVEGIERLVARGAVQGYPASVVLQSREDLLGLMPIHVAAENGRLETVEVGRGDAGSHDPYEYQSINFAMSIALCCKLQSTRAWQSRWNIIEADPKFAFSKLDHHNFQWPTLPARSSKDLPKLR